MPRLDREPVALPVLDARTRALWSALFDIADHVPGVWCLVGGQMVFLHALEAGREPPRQSRDLDIVADARARPSALHELVRALGDVGFESAGTSPGNVAHRFVRADVVVDLMVPEGLGDRADRRAVGSGVAVEVRGGTQALRRAEGLPVTAGDRRAFVPRPDLLGAIVVKAAAVRNERRNPQRHLLDLAFLCSLVDDPFLLGERLTRKDLRRLRLVEELDDIDHEAWQSLDRPEPAHAAYRLLCAPPGSS